MLCFGLINPVFFKIFKNIFIGVMPNGMECSTREKMAFGKVGNVGEGFSTGTEVGVPL